jgi:tRNA(Ile)-lysidine synthase
MSRFTPFERRPRLAVAVSGGSDSMALALLAHAWAKARGGEAVALTVDHGLRPESAAEARQVGAWLTARGIGHRVLPWVGDKPDSGMQDAARQARRDILLKFCLDQRILHLLLAHHADDQAETLLLRLAAGSGRDGLAGMSEIVESGAARMLRPLLGVKRAQLEATLIAAGQDWVEDRSNRDPRYARAALRELAAGPAEFAATARMFGRHRQTRETALAQLLARIVAVYPEGWALLDREGLAAAPPELGRRALARVLTTIGAADYTPRSEGLDRLHRAIVAGGLRGGRTLGGCRVVPRRAGLLVLREASACGTAVAISEPGDYTWDGRFSVRLSTPNSSSSVEIRALGTAGWTAIAAADKSLQDQSIPPVVRPVLPALWDLEGVLEVPHLLYRRRSADPDSVKVVSAVFRPRQSLAGAGFAVS